MNKINDSGRPAPYAAGSGSLSMRGIYDGRAVCGVNELYARYPSSTPEAALGLRGRRAGDWAPCGDFLDDGQYSLTFGSYLVEGIEGHTVLIDAGFGDRMSGIWKDKWATEVGQMRANLAAAGVEFDQVTDVVVSHLHFDHIGWLVVDGCSSMPNAVIHIHEAELAHYQRVSQAHREFLAPLEGQIRTWSQDGEVLPGVFVELAAGHTPGSAAVWVNTGPWPTVVTGDVVHNPVELVHDDWVGLGDLHVCSAHSSRGDLSRRVTDAQVFVANVHFPAMAIGRLVTDADGRRQWLTHAGTRDIKYQ